MCMMNNCWYVVRPKISYKGDSNEPAILFRHPTEPGTGDADGCSRVWNGEDNFVIEGKQRHFDGVSLVLGGSGLTPGLSLLARILLTGGNDTKISVVDVNKERRQYSSSRKVG